MARLSRRRVPQQAAENALGINGLADVIAIGSGGNSVVYRVRQIAFDRIAAVKVLNGSMGEEGERRFRREASLGGRLTGHPHIARIYDCGISGSGHPYLIMEFYPGGSLSDLIARNGRLPVDRLLAMGIELAGALATAHASGILHRDVKPANVLLDQLGQPALTDFGIAALASAGADITSVQTFKFAAPETFDDDDVPGPAIDQYGLALTLWSAAVGGDPWASLPMRQLVPLPPDLPAEFTSALSRATAPEPGDRYLWLGDFGAVLQAAQAALRLARTELWVGADDAFSGSADASPAARRGAPRALTGGDLTASPGSQPHQHQHQHQHQHSASDRTHAAHASSGSDAREQQSQERQAHQNPASDPRETTHSPAANRARQQPAQEPQAHQNPAPDPRETTHSPAANRARQQPAQEPQAHQNPAPDPRQAAKSASASGVYNQPSQAPQANHETELTRLGSRRRPDPAASADDADADPRRPKRVPRWVWPIAGAALTAAIIGGVLAAVSRPDPLVATELRVSPHGSGKVLLEWKDPTGGELELVPVSWSGTPAMVKYYKDKQTSPGQQYVEIEGLTLHAGYCFALVNVSGPDWGSASALVPTDGLTCPAS